MALQVTKIVSRPSEYPLLQVKELRFIEVSSEAQGSTEAKDLNPATLHLSPSLS